MTNADLSILNRSTECCQTSRSSQCNRNESLSDPRTSLFSSRYLSLPSTVPPCILFLLLSRLASPYIVSSSSRHISLAFPSLFAIYDAHFFSPLLSTEIDLTLWLGRIGHLHRGVAFKNCLDISPDCAAAAAAPIASSLFPFARSPPRLC